VIFVALDGAIVELAAILSERFGCPKKLFFDLPKSSWASNPLGLPSKIGCMRDALAICSKTVFGFCLSLALAFSLEN